MPPTFDFEDFQNRILVWNTHPPDWVSPEPKDKYHLVVIGGGTAGLTAAGGCAAVGGKVALIEKGFTGGDCLVTGCVPSKALIRAAKAAHAVASAKNFGIEGAGGYSVNFESVMERVRKARAQISPADSVKSLKDAGVDVFLGEARFTASDRVEVNGQTLRFAKAVIATGSRPYFPDIPGLSEIKALTTENVFELKRQPKKMIVLGGGPVGCELAQSFQRLGTEVYLIHRHNRLLPKDDPEAAQILERQLESEGVRIFLESEVSEFISAAGAECRAKVKSPQGLTEIDVDAVLVASGRRPNVESLNLSGAGIRVNAGGIETDAYGRTSNRSVFAAGDVSSKMKFTHAANVFGRQAFVNALLWGRGKQSGTVIPWCTYTDPEIAHVGLQADEARRLGYRVETLTVPFSKIDRAMIDENDLGFVRVYLKQGSEKVLGATVVCQGAGEMISGLTQLMASGKGVSQLGLFVYPYPTQSEALRQLANQYRQRQLKPWIKKVIKAVLNWRH